MCWYDEKVRYTIVVELYELFVVCCIACVIAIAGILPRCLVELFWFVGFVVCFITYCPFTTRWWRCWVGSKWIRYVDCEEYYKSEVGASDLQGKSSDFLIDSDIFEEKDMAPETGIGLERSGRHEKRSVPKFETPIFDARRMDPNAFVKGFKRSCSLQGWDDSACHEAIGMVIHKMKCDSSDKEYLMEIFANESKFDTVIDEFIDCFKDVRREKVSSAEKKLTDMVQWKDESMSAYMKRFKKVMKEAQEYRSSRGRKPIDGWTLMKNFITGIRSGRIREQIGIRDPDDLSKAMEIARTLEENVYERKRGARNKERKRATRRKRDSSVDTPDEGSDDDVGSSGSDSSDGEGSEVDDSDLDASDRRRKSKAVAFRDEKKRKGKELEKVKSSLKEQEKVSGKMVDSIAELTRGVADLRIYLSNSLGAAPRAEPMREGPIRCYSCQGLGHTSRFCPVQRTNNQMNYRNDKENF